MECRLCLFSASPKSLVSIHDNLHPLAQRIWSCCRLQVNKDDGLTDRICLPCVKNLELLNSFRSVCLQSDETSKRSSNKQSDIKVEEVLLEDLKWEDESKDDSPANDYSLEISKEDDTDDRDLNSPTPGTSKAFKLPKRLKRTKNSISNRRIEEAYNNMQQAVKIQSERDSSSTYGEYIANKHRTYSSRTKIMVEHLITNIIFEADVGRYEPNYDFDAASIHSPIPCDSSQLYFITSSPAHELPSRTPTSTSRYSPQLYY
ncbi:uncharacterized protein LOC143912515 isoform X2 [Arctopsyche grandis]|uniref:uncharacterized protein LOC143912515 isoform X2 n=1 Tax=Arctopsyche grandis TaxID=121162 RepID=UPI00406D7B6D